MSSESRSRAWRAWSLAIALMLGLGMLPGLAAPVPAAAQADELSQREFDDLVDDAQAEDPVFGPEDGDLELSEELTTLENADVELADFLVTATFQNPYAGSRQQFDYGIIFRSHEDGFDTQSLAFVVLSDGSWGVLDSAGGLIEEGSSRDVDDSRRGENTLTVYARDDVVHLGINGEYVASIDVPYDDAGDIAVASGFLTDSFQEGASTGYTGFAIWELDDRASQDDRSSQDEDEAQPDDAGAEYESPTYGYTLIYGEPWTAVESSQRGVDTLQLDNGTSRLQFVGTENDETPAECIDSTIDEVQSDDDLLDATVALDEDDEELRGEVDDGEFVVLQVTVDGDDGPVDLTMYVSCLPIDEGESMLEITHVANSDDYNDEIENRAAVLDTLSIDGSSTAPDRDDAETPDEEPTPESTESDELPEGSATVFLETVEEDGPFVFATLIPGGDETAFTMLLLPVESRIDYVVTINTGTCRRPGDVEFEVGTVDDSGLLEDVVDAPVEELVNGDYIVIVSDGGDPDAVIACGPIEPSEEAS